MERRRRWEVSRERRLRQQRRQQRRNDPARRARRRRLILASTGVVIVGLVVAGVVIWWPEKKPNLSTGPIRNGSELLREDGRALKLRQPLESYRIVYRVDDFAGGDRRVSTDVLSVRRPFESRSETLEGRPPGKKRLAATISGFGTFGNDGQGGNPLLAEVAPNLAGGDVRFDGVLDDLVERDVLQLRERRRVLGRECQIYRTGEPISGGRLTAPKDDEYADECIDDRGLILEELWVVDGKPLRRKLAVEAEISPKLRDALFTVEADPLPLDQGGGNVRPLEPSNRPRSTYWELAKAPKGFDHQGRYLIATPRPGGQAPGMPAIPSITFVDVYVSGPDMILIEQGDVGDRQGEFENQPGAETVKVGELGRAKLTVGVLASTVRARPDDVQFVIVKGTVPSDELVKIVSTLQPQRGGDDLKPLAGEDGGNGESGAEPDAQN